MLLPKGAVLPYVAAASGRKTPSQAREVDFTQGVAERIVGSNDGGITWTPWPSGTEAGLRGVAFLDGNNGWAVGDGGTILKFGPL